MEQLNLSHPLVRPDWLASVTEAVLDPDRPIIDPHHHLWHDRPSGRYMIEELAHDLGSGHRIVATVFMQCAWRHRTSGPDALRPAGESEAVAACATLFETGAYGPSHGCKGIVSFADLRSPDLDATLDAHVASGGGRFRGIRHSAAFDPQLPPTVSIVPPAGLLSDPAFQAGLRRLGERGFTFDAWLYHPQLAALVDAARAAPDTPIVIDHVGGPLGAGPYRSQREEARAVWREGMMALAKLPNVHVKLGGLAMPLNGFDYHTDPSPPTSERLAADWGPWMTPCIEWFGVDRCMFESNFPVDKGMCSYPVVWNAFKRIAGAASESEKTALFHDTAARFYKLV